MKAWLIRIFTNACALAVATWLFDGIDITGHNDRNRVLTLIVVAFLFGVVNEFVRPVVAFLSIPLYLITLGLMYFVVNALMLLLTSWICDWLDIGFHVDGFWTAVWGGIVIAIVSWIVSQLLPEPDGHGWR
ncbi:MAG TPA: phage holin family protein [Nocardioidaceae bacterium]|jgi:putative membrane protein